MTLASLQGLPATLNTLVLRIMAKVAAGALVAGGALAAKLKLVSFTKRAPFIRVHFRRMNAPVWPPKAVPKGVSLVHTLSHLSLSKSIDLPTRFSLKTTCWICDGFRARFSLSVARVPRPSLACFTRSRCLRKHYRRPALGSLLCSEMYISSVIQVLRPDL